MDLNIGRMPHGPRNSIADVSGVRVGHCTVDDERHKNRRNGDSALRGRHFPQ